MTTLTAQHPEALSLAAIQSAIAPSARNKLGDILLHDTITSTNDALWRRLDQGHTNPAVALSEMQTSGRGRQGNHWHSPPSGNLYLSIFWPFAAKITTYGLSIAIGTSVIDTLEYQGVQDLQIKWPNDILHKRQKLAGILVETRFGRELNAVIGIGINIALPVATQEQIRQPTTSLKQLGVKVPCRNQLAGQIIQKLITTLEQFQQHGLAHFMSQWQRYDALKDQAITLTHGNEHINAVACGINEKGELYYRYNNQLHTLSNSHVSIRLT